MASRGDGSGPLFLGLDASTQALKASLITDDLAVQAEVEVRFDSDLPHFNTQGGTLTGPKASGIVYSPVMLIVEAMDLLFERIKEAGWPLSRVRGVSAAGQQHASVYWSHKASAMLASVRPEASLASQLTQEAFSRSEVPNWQDSSTMEQCAELERRLGGQDSLARLTGSKAHLRFTGPQIMRFRQSDPSAYEDTWRISLVSSFVTTLLCLDGEVKGIDESDACGMNLWNMSTDQRGWAKEAIDVVAGCDGQAGADAGEQLMAKLGHVESDGGRVVGQIGKWYVGRYGFSPDCVVCPGTGDNPATFLSFTLRANQGLVSLGTSDTVLISTSTYAPDPQFHAFFHPAQIVPPSCHDGRPPRTAPKDESDGAAKMRYFNMLVYKNGSLAREFVRDRYFDKSWDTFDTAVKRSLPRTQDDVDKVSFWWLKTEIIPANAQGVLKFEGDKTVEEFADRDDNALAMLASQMLNYRSRSNVILAGSSSSQGSASQSHLTRVFATGGAAANATICGLMADILGCDVCKPVEYDASINNGRGGWKNVHYNACSVAVAYKAAWAWSRHVASSHGQAEANEPFDDFVQRASERRRLARTRDEARGDQDDAIVEEGVAIVARPDSLRSQIYSGKVEWWRGMEEKALQESQGKHQKSDP